MARTGPRQMRVRKMGTGRTAWFRSSNFNSDLPDEAGPAVATTVCHDRPCRNDTPPHQPQRDAFAAILLRPARGPKESG